MMASRALCIPITCKRRTRAAQGLSPACHATVAIHADDVAAIRLTINALQDVGIDPFRPAVSVGKLTIVSWQLLVKRNFEGVGLM